MCTVSFVALQDGYALGMNRDEQRSRPEALPPQLESLRGRAVIFPREPSGGTWIGLNESGAAFALINWYSIDRRVESGLLSRGQVVRAVLPGATAPEAERVLQETPLARVNPFRLIGIFPAARRILEWQWDLRSLRGLPHSWETRAWFSSGFDESGAMRTRAQVFEKARVERPIEDPDWIRSLHASHLPEQGPYSICMHRPDAATVSYTEIRVSAAAATLRYSAGPPCLTAATQTRELALSPFKPASLG